MYNLTRVSSDSFFFFFKQKTAYEISSRDWSSDVCSSDLDVAAAHAARDKHEQRTLLAAVGVPVPRFTRYGVDDDPRRLAAGVSYPCVLKPLRLAASRGVIRADTPEAFVAAFERVKRILRDTGSGMRDAGCVEAG